MKNFSMIKRTLIFFSFFLFSIAPPSAQAQEQEEPEKPKISVEDIQDIESLGLFEKANEGSLGRDLWRGSDRSAITALIKEMPASSKYPAVNTLILRTLLTSADTEKLEGDTEPEYGSDLLTLRMDKLIEAGAYTQAYALYGKLEEPPYHENLAKAGLLAMLYAGEKSFACLESNTYLQRFDEMPFIKAFKAYCDVSLSDEDNQQAAEVIGLFEGTLIPTLAQDKSYRFKYTPDTFTALNTIEQALLAAEDRLDISDGTRLDIKDIPNAHIQILLRVESLPPELEFKLTAKAEAMGLIEDGELEKLYGRIFKSFGEGKDLETLPAPEHGFEKLAYYHRKAEKAQSAEKWQHISAALDLLESYEPEALKPFGSMIYNQAPQGLDIKSIFAAYKVLNGANLSIPKDWLSQLDNKNLENKNSAICMNLLSAAAFSDPARALNENKKGIIHAALQQNTDISSPLLSFIMKNIDIWNAPGNNRSIVYEKDFFLTHTADYVMPSIVVWDRLAKAEDAKAVGETILLSTILLRNQSLQKTYPGLTRDILQSFDNVGLKNASRDIAIAASLESMDHK